MDPRNFRLAHTDFEESLLTPITVRTLDELFDDEKESGPEQTPTKSRDLAKFSDPQPEQVS
jgi:hypothetical protein